MDEDDEPVVAFYPHNTFTWPALCAIVGVVAMTIILVVAAVLLEPGPNKNTTTTISPG